MFLEVYLCILDIGVIIILIYYLVFLLFKTIKSKFQKIYIVSIIWHNVNTIL